MEPLRRNSKADPCTVDAMGEGVSARDVWTPFATKFCVLEEWND